MREKGIPGRGTSVVKGMNLGKTIGKIKARGKVCEVKQWWFVVWGAQESAATATLWFLKRRGAHRKSQEHHCHQVNSASWVTVQWSRAPGAQQNSRAGAGPGQGEVTGPIRAIWVLTEVLIPPSFWSLTLLCQGHNSWCACAAKRHKWISYLNLPLTEHLFIMCQALCWELQILIATLKNKYYPCLGNEETEVQKS